MKETRYEFRTSRRNFSWKTSVASSALNPFIKFNFKANPKFQNLSRTSIEKSEREKETWSLFVCLLAFLTQRKEKDRILSACLLVGLYNSKWKSDSGVWCINVGFLPLQLFSRTAEFSIQCTWLLKIALPFLTCLKSIENIWGEVKGA